MVVRARSMRLETNLVLVPEIAAKEPNMSITMARMEEILESFNARDVDRIVGNFLTKTGNS